MYAVAALLVLHAGVAAFFVRPTAEEHGTGAAALVVAAGLVYVVVAAAVVMRTRWAWGAALAVAAVGFVGDLSAGRLISTNLALLILLVLGPTRESLLPRQR